MKPLQNRLVVAILCIAIYIPVTPQLIRGQTQSPDAALTFLQTKAATDPWAKYYLACAYYFADRSAFFNIDFFFEGTEAGANDTPQQAAPYKAALKTVVNGTFRGDEKKAASIWKENAEAGHAASMAAFANLLWDGSAGVQKDPVAAEQWAQKAADLQDPMGMALRAMFYMDPAKDATRAFPLALKAAQKGNHLAMMMLIGFYSQGAGTPKDPVQAARWNSESDRIQALSEPKANQPGGQSASKPSTPGPSASGSSPSPPAAPAAPAANTSLSNSFADAPFITGREFMKTVRAVRIELYAVPDVLQQVTQQELFDTAVGAIVKYGIEVRSDAPVTLKLTIQILENSISVPHPTGIVKDPIAHYFVAAAFRLTTPVLRGSEFHLLDVAPASSFEFNSFTGTAKHSDYLTTYAKAISDDLDTIATDDGLPASQSWYATNWTPQQKQDMQKLFISCLASKGSDISRSFLGLTKTPDVEISFMAKAGDFLNQATVKSQWNNLLAANHFSGPVDPNFVITQNIWVQELDANNLANATGLNKIFGVGNAAYYVVWDEANLSQRDVVFPLDGRLFRADAQLWTDLGIDLEDVDAGASNVSSKAVAHMISEFGKSVSQHR